MFRNPAFTLVACTRVLVSLIHQAGPLVSPDIFKLWGLVTNPYELNVK